MLKQILKLSDKEVDYYITAFDKAFQRPTGEEPKLTSPPLLIATSSRTGGMYLAALLENHGYFEIDEYLNPFKSRQVEQGANNFLANLEKRAQTDGRRFGIKASIYDLMPYIFKYTPPFNFNEAHWIYLTREDLVDQAISLVIAEKTKVWSIRSEKDKADELPVSAEDISPELVLDRVAVIAEDMRRWEIFFSLNGISPVRITYGELNTDPANVIKKLGEKFEFHCSSLDLNVAIQKQRDDRNLTCRKNLQAYLGIPLISQP